jgi:hypothetical protein
MIVIYRGPPPRLSAVEKFIRGCIAEKAKAAVTVL